MKQLTLEQLQKRLKDNSLADVRSSLQHCPAPTYSFDVGSSVVAGNLYAVRVLDCKNKLNEIL